MDREPVEREEYAHVPWAELVADTKPDRTKLLVVGVALMAAAALGLFGSRLLLATPHEPVAAAPTTSQAAAPQPPTTQPTPLPTEAAAVAPPALYAEADLMAVLPQEELRAAALRAEWFVRDYFTRDGVTTAERLGGALPPEAPEVTDTPGGATTYVEWAEAMRVDSPQPGHYVVTVAFRMLADSGDGAFDRQSVRAVSVPVITDANGIPAIADIPAPVELQPAAPASWPTPEPAPAAVEAAALRSAASIGTDPAVIEASRSDTGWRVIVAVNDPVGIRWPLRIDVADDQ